MLKVVDSRYVRLPAIRLDLEIEQHRNIYSALIASSGGKVTEKMRNLMVFGSSVLEEKPDLLEEKPAVERTKNRNMASITL